MEYMEQVEREAAEQAETKLEHLVELQKLGSVDLGPGDILIVSVDIGKMHGGQIVRHFKAVEDYLRVILNTAGHNEVELMVVNNTTNFSVLKMVEHPIV